RAADRAGARRGHALRRARLARALRERLREGRRVRDLPVLDGNPRDDRLRRDVEPDPARGERGAEGGAEARAVPARDAALADPPREHAAREAGGGDGSLPRAGLLPRGRLGERPRRLHRRPLPRPARALARARTALGSGMSIPAGTLPAEGVRAMFDRIAPVYDAMNRVMSAGLDGRWRAETAAAVVRPGDRVLDSCCGTGDLALASARIGGRVTGVDFSER